MFLRFAAIPLLFALAHVPAMAQLPEGDMQAACDSLKSAKDSDGIKQSGTECLTLINKWIATPEPATLSEKDKWQANVELAKSLQSSSEYAMFTAAYNARGAKALEMFDAFEKASPKSKYLSELYGVYLGALAQAGQTGKAYEYAAKAIARDPNNEELLLVLGDGAMTRKQWDRAAGYGLKLATVMTNHAKPEGYSAADWEKRKSSLIGRGYWIAGMSYASANKFPAADKNLRAALPYIKGDNFLMNGALFYLGLADYNLARITRDKVMMKQALAYSEEAFKIGGAYSQSANQNAYAIKQELARW